MTVKFNTAARVLFNFLKQIVKHSTNTNPRKLDQASSSSNEPGMHTPEPEL